MSNDSTFTAWTPLLIGMESGSTEQPAERALADWTRLLADGDDEAWRWFHARYYIALLLYAAHRSGDASAASEIVQQAYLRIARHAKPFAAERDFTGWLCCVVRCAAVDHTRHIARRSLLAEKFAHWRAAVRPRFRLAGFRQPHRRPHRRGARKAPRRRRRAAPPQIL